MERNELELLASRVQTYDSFGRSLGAALINAAVASGGFRETEVIQVPLTAELRLRTTLDGGSVVVGCICVTGEGCPCVPLIALD